MIEQNLLKYCKKIYLLHGMNQFEGKYFWGVSENPFFEEYFNNNEFSSDEGKFLIETGYIETLTGYFHSRALIRFTKKFLELLDKELDN